ncbi:hypothetical protein [Deinococcus hopiensis]|uniref:hypothetical protein n=1 Tax=Deinococcus hopiensis TaxID=309885 RepID=UPI00111C1A67|nr:hypothetical protein [Deinococcus hopiensis]
MREVFLWLLGLSLPTFLFLLALCRISAPRTPEEQAAQDAEQAHALNPHADIPIDLVVLLKLHYGSEDF